MSVVIAAASTCLQTPAGNFVSPTNWKSFSQWHSLFREVRLIVPAKRSKVSNEGWCRLPDSITVCPLDILNKNYLVRRKTVLKAAKEYLKGADMLYARMPDYSVYWTFCVAAKRKIPVLLELHGDWETAAISHKTGNILKRITSPFRPALLRLATLKMAKTAFAVVTIGPELAKKYVPADKPLLISTNHTVDSGMYRPRHHFELNSVPQLLFVGELVDRKGLRYLFEALDILVKQGSKFNLTLAGAGPEQNCLADYARRHTFADRIKFLGYVPFGRQLLDLYHQADAFVLPSTGGEGVPRVLHEAMSQGCPVIATDIGSTKWQLENDAGIVVPPGNAQVLSEAISSVLTNKLLRQNLSEKGYERSLQFTFENQAAQIAAFVRQYVPAKLLT